MIKAFDPVGLARYLEGYDGGGQRDYTKEKYGQPVYFIEKILAMKNALFCCVKQKE